MEPRTAVIVVAAGAGERLGRPEPKAFVPLAGRPILVHALDRVFGMRAPAQVVVVAPPTHLEQARELALAAAGAAADHVAVVPGGPTRQASVAAGLAVLHQDVRIVLVHDAARPLTPVAQFERVLEAVGDGVAGAVPALPVSDTVKRVDGDGVVLETVDRSRLAAVQTPQGFPRETLVDAYRQAEREYTDDAALFAAAGHQVRTVEGSPAAFKITTSWDLRRAEHEFGAVGARTGIGVDVHRFDPDSPLWLGGLLWPGEPGLAGHSDGDALAHAICDALLGSAGLGDIGSRFGTADPRFAGAHGDVFLGATVDLLRRAHHRVVSVAAQIVANHPKIAARRPELEHHLSELVGAPVTVSATTSDGLGFTGRGEGLMAIATALTHHTP